MIQKRMNQIAMQNGGKGTCSTASRTGKFGDKMKQAWRQPLGRVNPPDIVKNYQCHKRQKEQPAEEKKDIIDSIFLGDSLFM